MKLRINNVEPMTDGSGMTALDVWALNDASEEIPGMHRTVLLPSADVNAAMALSTPAQKATAMKTLITTAVEEMKDAELAKRVAANNAAATAAAALNTTYKFPVTITL